MSASGVEEEENRRGSKAQLEQRYPAAGSRRLQCSRAFPQSLGRPSWVRAWCVEGEMERGAVRDWPQPHSPASCAVEGQELEGSEMEGWGWAWGKCRWRGKSSCNIYLCFSTFKSVLVGSKLNEIFPSWVCFACDVNWYVISLSLLLPMSFSTLFSPPVLSKRGSERTSGRASECWPSSTQQQYSNTLIICYWIFPRIALCLTGQLLLRVPFP